MGDPPAIFRWIPPGPTFIGFLAHLYVILYILRRCAQQHWGAGCWEVWVRRMEGAVLSLLLLGAVVLSALQIVLRNVFHGGLIWIDPLLRYAVLWIGLVGAFVATRRLRHITIDAIGRNLPPRWKRPVRMLTSAVSLTACFLLANASWAYLQGEVLFGARPFLGIPSWAAASILVIGFAGMGWRFAGWMLWPASGGPGRPPPETDVVTPFGEAPQGEDHHVNPRPAGQPEAGSRPGPRGARR